MEKRCRNWQDLLQGSIIQGDPSLKLTGVNGLEEAGPTEISFAVPPYLELAGKSRAGAIMIPEEGELKGPQALIRVKNPRAAFAKLLMLFRPPESCRIRYQSVRICPSDGSYWKKCRHPAFCLYCRRC